MQPAAAAPAAAAARRKKKRRHTNAPLHEPTAAPVTGAGAAAARAPGRRARSDAALWDFTLPAPPCVDRNVNLRAVPRSALAAAHVELARARSLDRLRKRLHELCVAAGLEAPPQLAFERWRFGCKLQEELERPEDDSAPASRKKRKRPLAGPEDGIDALLPCAPGGGDGGGLEADLVRAGLTAEAAADVAAALHASSRAEQAAVAALSRWLNSGGSVAATAPQLTVAFHRHTLELSLGPAFVTLGREAYGKLAALHRAHAPPEERAPAPDGNAADDADAEAAAAAAAAAAPDCATMRDALHARLFTLLLRYKALKGHGFQAAAGPRVFCALEAHCGVAFECFASPLNARFARFCSAFPDTDAPFGSAGSFFAFSPSSGAFEINPPFVPALLDAAAARALALLDAAEAARGALAFAVLLPGWRELAGRAMLRASRHARFTACIAAADHGFLDGAAHARQDPFRASPYDTDVIVLQTSAAAAATPLRVEALEADLRAAFAACCPSDAAAKRQRRAGP